MNTDKHTPEQIQAWKDRAAHLTKWIQDTVDGEQDLVNGRQIKKYQEEIYLLELKISEASMAAELADLREWKRQQIEICLPLVEYMQFHPERKVGDSISEKALQFIKERDENVAELERLRKENAEAKKIIWEELSCIDEHSPNRRRKLQDFLASTTNPS